MSAGKSRKRVLLDCDGVLADFCSAFVELINLTLGTAHTADQVKRFDVCRELGLEPGDAAKVKRRIGDTLGFASNLAVYPGAKDGVRRLREVADVFVVTSPWNSNPTWTHDREEWLWRHFRIPHAHVIHTSAKHVCDGHVFVDDKREAVEVWHATHGSGALQWANAHNALDRWDGFVTDSWDTLVEWCR